MKKYGRYLQFLLAVMLALLSCSCQTELSRPADHVFDVNNGRGQYILDLSGMELPDTSKTFVLEVRNSSGVERVYELTALLSGNLPLICEFTAEAENGSGKAVDGSTVTDSIRENEKHRYTLTVSWPAEENGYVYAGGTAIVTVEGTAR